MILETPPARILVGGVGSIHSYSMHISNDFRKSKSFWWVRFCVLCGVKTEKCTLVQITGSAFLLFLLFYIYSHFSNGVVSFHL